jgi:hypothetical protein
VLKAFDIRTMREVELSLEEAVEVVNEKIKNVIAAIERGELISINTTDKGAFLAAKKNDNVYLFGKDLGKNPLELPRVPAEELFKQIYNLVPFAEIIGIVEGGLYGQDGSSRKINVI